MGSCAAPSAKGDDKFITTDYLQQCPSGCTNQRGAGQIHCTIFSPTASASLRMLPEQHAAEARYPIPVEDFHFSIFTAVNNQTVMTSSAEIVLVIEGTATLSHASGESLLLHVGLSAFIPASIGRWLLTTRGRFRLRAK
ncbi:hypothetical protein [Escherichia coli]|uniref:hypothetical protein n=1 Tax=Escherichia coli TaxID=562 RepID=UPI0038908EAE